jgi:hypothetical protein
MPQGEEGKMIPDWAKGILKEWIPNLVAEFIGVQGIKNLLRRGRERADEKVAKTEGKEGEEQKKPEVQHGGLFNLSDEEACLELMSQITRKEAVKISAFLRMYLEPWQQRRFRASVGNLGEIVIPSNSEWISLKKSEFAKKYTQRNGEITPGEEQRTEYEQKEKKTGGSKINLGVKFLKSFAKCNEEEMLDICEAAGIMHSDFEAVKQAWKEFETWADAQGPAIVKSINGLAEKLELRAGERMATKPIKPPERPYPGFWKAFTGRG